MFLWSGQGTPFFQARTFNWLTKDKKWLLRLLDWLTWHQKERQWNIKKCQVFRKNHDTFNNLLLNYVASELTHFCCFIKKLLAILDALDWPMYTITVHEITGVIFHFSLNNIYDWLLRNDNQMTRTDNLTSTVCQMYGPVFSTINKLPVKFIWVAPFQGNPFAEKKQTNFPVLAGVERT